MKPLKAFDIIQEITFKTGLSQSEIASRIGYSRPHLNRVMHGDEKGSDKIIGRLESEFPEIVRNMYNSTVTSVKVKTTNDDTLKRIEELEKKIQELEAQLKLIVSLLKK